MAEYTPYFVQDVITNNLQAAEDAVRYAEFKMHEIANAYTDIQNDVPTNRYVDVNIGANANIVWPNAVGTVASPVEPNYASEVPSTISVGSVTTPGEVWVDTRPQFNVDLSSIPQALPASEVGAVAVLEPLPLIEVAIPMMDVALLTADFSFTETPYTPQLADDVRINLERVLGGDMGIPQSYWDDLWTEVSNDLARQQTGALRQARNRGAATHWGLPTETVLVASRAIADEGQRKLTQVRLEQAKQQAVFAREDFWQAIGQAIAYENQWLAFHNQVQARALTAAEQTYGLRVQVHNANINRYNAMLEGAKLDGSIDDLKVQRVLKKHSSELSANTLELEQDKTVLQRFLAGWQGYTANTDAQIKSVGEQVRWWNGQTDAHSRYETLKLEKAKIDVQNYSAILAKIEAVSRATASVLGARTGVSQFQLANQVSTFDTDTKKNAAELDKTRITLAAQEANTKLQIAQTEWLSGQGNTLLNNLAQLAVGLAQSWITVSDVNLGATASESISSSTTASRNEQKVW